MLSELLHPHGSGAELATSLWIRFLAQSGFQIRVITSIFQGEPVKSSSKGLEIFRLPLVGSSGQKYSLLRRSPILFSGLFQESFEWADLVYIPRFWYSAIPVAKAHGKPVVTHLHDYIPICSLATRYDLSRNENCTAHAQCHPSCVLAHERAKGSPLLQTIGSALLNVGVWPFVGQWILLSDAIICISGAQRKILTTRMPSLARKSRLIYNLLPEVTATSVDGKDFGYFGGSNPVKGHNALVRAAGLTKTPATVQATGFEHQMRTDLPNGSRVLFRRRLPDLEFERVYRKIRTVVVPSIWEEPWAYVTSEAILRGRLVIASSAGGTPEQTAQCPGAFLVPPMNEMRLAELMDYATNLDKEDASDLALKSREVLLERFDNRSNVKQFADLLQKLVSRS